MTKNEAVAYIQAQSVAALCEIESMKAANTERQDQGYALAYDEEAFLAVIDRYGISHNAVLITFQGAD